jgi:hydrogenase 3 maturation protease
MKSVILTVGNSMMGDDGAGPLLAELLVQRPAPGWIVIEGGSMPENHADEVLRHNPCRIIVFDAAEMGVTVGKVHTIAPDTIADLFFMTTHNLPLNFLIERLQQACSRVELVGIQPAVVAFSFPMTEAVREGVKNVYSHLCAGTPLPDFAPPLTADRLKYQYS